MTEREQELLERQHAREELLSSDGWKRIAVPVLKARMVEMERRAMGAKTMEELKNIQGAWTVLEMMLNTPMAFFGERTKE